jgi:branched-chain amino acid transport system ATP-binding protein
MTAPNALLELSRVEIAYGGIQAVKGIDLHVDKGELVCLIGTNGAGKTTTLKGITGLQPVKDGAIRYAGENVTGRPAFELVRKGLAMVPEGRGVFGALTIEENLAMGAYIRTDKAAIGEDVERVFALFPRLKERRRQTAGTLSGGEQQMLAMGPRADVEAEAPAAGRAVDGTGAAHGAEGVRDRAQGIGRGASPSC